MIKNSNGVMKMDQTVVKMEIMMMLKMQIMMKNAMAIYKNEDAGEEFVTSRDKWIRFNITLFSFNFKCKLGRVKNFEVLI
jgi:hypothetical protein